MTIEAYDIVGSYNNQRITSIDAERTVNLFEYLDPKGKKEKSLLPTSGLLNANLIFAGASGGYRNQFVANSGATQTGFMVIGSDVFRVDQLLNVTKINTSPLTTSVGWVGIDANNGTDQNEIQVIFVDGDKGYIYNLTTTIWEPITDPSFPIKPIDVCYLDGFFIVANGDSPFFQLSELNQGLVWGGVNESFTAVAATDLITVPSTAGFTTGLPFTVVAGGGLPAPLVAGTTYYAIRISATEIKLASTYANAIAGVPINLTTDGTPPNTIVGIGQLQRGAISSHPGTIVACRTLHRNLFLFSQYFTEVWENKGIGSNLPVRRNNGLLMEYGTPAIGSIATGFDKMFFLSQSVDGLGAVMEVAGTEAIPVSNKALDYTLAQYISDPLKGVSDARGFLVKENGLIFYRLNFTRANHTFVFGVSTSDPQNLRWHEEEVLNGDRHPAQTHFYFYGRNYVGHYNSPTLYLLDDSYDTNDGEAIRRMRIGRPIIPKAEQRLRVDRFQLDLLQGQLSSAQMIADTLSLLTETSLDLLTEAGDTIFLDQSLVIFDADDPPVVFFSFSKDGGQSYGYRIQAKMGEVGQRTFRTVWRKLGTTKRGQAFVPRIEFFNKTKFIVLGAVWNFEVLPQ